MKRPAFFFPIIIALCLAAAFVVKDPGQIKKDAAEYDALAVSIQHGQYAVDGAPSMQREPGYPLFRAVVKTINPAPSFVLWVQVLLFGLMVWLVGDAARRIEPRAGAPAAWAAAFSYGLALYAARHLLEMWSAVLLAFVGWSYVRCLETTRWKWRIILSASIAALLLTRFSFLFVPIALIGGLAYIDVKTTKNVRRSILSAVGLCALTGALIAPWIIRNGFTFGQWGVTDRTGIVLFARAEKAETPWSTLWSSYGSVVIGQSALARLFPQAHPLTTEKWVETWAAYDDRIAHGASPAEADQDLRRVALRRITANPTVFSRYVLWSGVDVLRLIALPSPRSTEFPIEGMFAPVVGSLSLSQWVVLCIADLIQLVWWALIVWSVYAGFRRYGFRFVPGLIVCSTILAYAPADDILRYGVPIIPWMLAGIVLALTPLIQTFSFFRTSQKS